MGRIYQLRSSEGNRTISGVREILCYIFNNLVAHLERLARLGRRFFTVAVYLVFLAVVVGLFLLVLPHIVSEARQFITKIPQSIDAIHLYLENKPER